MMRPLTRGVEVQVSGGAADHAAAQYAVISTVRNEEEFIAQTAEALISQTITPRTWLIVDDGSTDGTLRIVEDYARHFDWIRVLSLGELGGSNRCSRIMRAFLTGFEQLDEEVGYVIKMDGDVTCEADHIERLLAHFEEDSRLGIASGTYTEPAGQGWRIHTLPEGYAVGALRAYRAKCLSEIVDAAAPSLIHGSRGDNGSSERVDELALSWDSVDHLYAEEAGWTTRCFHDLIIVHHRTEGARSHILRGQFEQGVVSYVMGYHPLFALARGVFKAKDYPYVVGGVALTLGYATSVFRPGVIRADETTRRLVRERQMRRIRMIFGRGDAQEGDS